MTCIPTRRHRLSSLVISVFLVRVAAAVAGCGSDGATPSNAGSPGSGNNSWSVNQLNTDGSLASCVNYTHQKVTAAQAMTMIQGGTVSANPCPVASNFVGVCSGVDAGGNDFEQIFYNFSGFTGATLTAATQSLVLNCSAINGTWSTTYDGKFPTTTTGSGAGGSSGGTGGSSGSTNSCAQLLACCNASGQLEQACMSIYNAAGGNAMSCASVLSGIRSLYCPG